METPEPPVQVPLGPIAPLACPVTFERLDADGVAPSSNLKYAPDELGIWDLTIGAAGGGAKPASITDVVRGALPKELRGLLPTSSYLGTSTFETPQVAFAYERGWRDSFKRAGFPGPDEEYDLARAKLLPHAADKVLVDASCGSGLFTRRFAKSGDYSAVVALDYSAAMLTQARQFAIDEGLLDASGAAKDDNTDITFVRADIARMPFPEGSVGGVNAGAAINCWPDPRAAAAEIARALERGGSFCGTTFLTPRVPFLDDAGQQQLDAAMREVQDAISGRAGGARGFRMWNRADLKDLCEECGLVDFESDVRDGFIFFSAKKP